MAVFSHAKFQGMFFFYQLTKSQVTISRFLPASSRALAGLPSSKRKFTDFGGGISNTLQGKPPKYPGNGTDGTGVFYLHLGPKLPTFGYINRPYIKHLGCWKFKYIIHCKHWSILEMAAFSISSTEPKCIHPLKGKSFTPPKEALSSKGKHPGRLT